MDTFNETFIVEDVVAHKKPAKNNTGDHYGYVKLADKEEREFDSHDGTYGSSRRIVCYLASHADFADINTGDEFVLTRKTK